jgi:hypothetical protein
MIPCRASPCFLATAMQTGRATSPRAQLGPPRRSKVHGACCAREVPKTASSWCHIGTPVAESLDPLPSERHFWGARSAPKSEARSAGVEGPGLRSPRVTPTFPERGFGRTSRGASPVDLTSLGWTQLSSRTGLDFDLVRVGWTSRGEEPDSIYAHEAV